MKIDKKMARNSESHNTITLTDHKNSGSQPDRKAAIS